MGDGWVVVAVLVLAFGTVTGLAAVTRDRLPPGRGREKVRRPRLWGYGTLLGMAGMGVFLFVGPLQGPDAGRFPVATAGMGVFFAGLWVQRLATRPAKDRRTRQTGETRQPGETRETREDRPV
ncbi:hypothetical protein ACIPSE_06950 [Streptomyces sp. NPDC090106]|uniref:hypothetical protein n=1 Tax=Streptomyces sp. NPDC090106 TaxID=3365946 RepID=UPI003802621E